MKETRFKDTEVGKAPVDLEIKTIVEMCKGRNQLTKEGEYPVSQNTNYPLGYFDKYNVEANNPFVIIGGFVGLIGYSKINYWTADDCAYFECF